MIALLFACAPADRPLTDGYLPVQLALEHADDEAWIAAHRGWLERFAATGDARSNTGGRWAIDALAKLPGTEGREALRRQLYGPTGWQAAEALARRPDGCEALYQEWLTSDVHVELLTRALASGTPSCVDTLHLTEPGLLQAYRVLR